MPELFEFFEFCDAARVNGIETACSEVYVDPNPGMGWML